jgi:metal-responsive CopG/Arc/MetJ family transcriptional regulator
MRRTTVFLEEELLKKARRYATKAGKSFAQVVREALREHITEEDHMKRKLPSLAGQFAWGHSDTAERVDELLWQDPHR